VTVTEPAAETITFTRADEDRMIEDCLSVVRPLAWRQSQRLPPHSVSVEELVSLAHEGLVGAARHYGSYCAKHGFNPHQRAGQRAYSTARVKGSMLDFLRQCDYASRAARARARQLEEASNGHRLTDAELARRTGLTTAQVRDAQRQTSRSPVSLDDGPAGSEGRDLADPEADPESAAVANSLQAAAAEAFRQLDPLAQVVVAFCFHKQLSAEEAAEAMRPHIVLSEAEVTRIRDESALEIHNLMILAACDDGQVPAPVTSGMNG
jgi:RNA polymerase sigma factor for flagellar operon FliA